MDRNNRGKKRISYYLLAVLLILAILFSFSNLSATFAADSLGDSAKGSVLPATSEQQEPVFLTEEELKAEFASLVQEAEEQGADFDGFIVELAPGAENLSKTTAEESTEEIAYAEHLCVAASAEDLLDDYDCRDVVGVEPDYILSLFDIDDPETDDPTRDPSDPENNDLDQNVRNPEADPTPVITKPNDPLYKNQNNLTMMNVPYIWSKGYEGQSAADEDPVVVAVIDSGINLSHEDFDPTHVLEGHHWTKNDNKEVLEDNDVTDDLGHGTVCASIIMATKNNELGTAGILPQTYLMPLKAFGAKDTSMSLAISAIYYAVEHGADVINMSFGGTSLSAKMKEACEYAANAGVLLVASAGNVTSSCPKGTVEYPAAFACVVGVDSIGLSNDDYRLSSFSLEVADNTFCVAPGENIRGANMGASDAYVTKNGTSFACPEAAALGALAKSVDRHIVQKQFQQLIAKTCTDLGDEGRDDRYGYGLINFENALDRLLEGNLELYEESSADPGEEITEPEPKDPPTEEDPVIQPPEEKPSSPADEEKPVVKKVTPTVTLSAASYAYNGKVRTPKVTVSVGGKKLKTTDYTVKYASGRKKVGTYKVKVTLKGTYQGSKTVSFNIRPAKTAVVKLTKGSKAFTVKWKKQATQSTGYQIQYSTDKNFKTGTKTVTIKNNKVVSRKIRKLQSKKTYYVRVRTYKTVNGKKICSLWSATKKVKVR